MSAESHVAANIAGCRFARIDGCIYHGRKQCSIRYITLSAGTPLSEGTYMSGGMNVASRYITAPAGTFSARLHICRPHAYRAQLYSWPIRYMRSNIYPGRDWLVR